MEIIKKKNPTSQTALRMKISSSKGHLGKTMVYYSNSLQNVSKILFNTISSDSLLQDKPLLFLKTPACTCIFFTPLLPSLGLQLLTSNSFITPFGSLTPCVRHNIVKAQKLAIMCFSHLYSL